MESGNFQPTLQPLDVFHGTVKRLKAYIAWLYKNACPIQSNGYKAHDIYICLSRRVKYTSFILPIYVLKYFLKGAETGELLRHYQPIHSILHSVYYMDAAGWVRLVENMCAHNRLKWHFEWFSSPAAMSFHSMCRIFINESMLRTRASTTQNIQIESRASTCLQLAAMSEIFRIKCVAC